MRILFLSKRLPRPGITSGDTMVYERIARLAARGHEIGLACFCAGTAREHIENTRQHLMEMEMRPPPPVSLWRRRFWCPLCSRIPPRYSFAYDPGMSRLVGEMVERGRYDVVIAEFSSMGQHICRNPYLPAVRKIISCHRSATMMCDIAMHVLPHLSFAYVRERIRIHGLKRFEFGLYRAVDRVLVLTPKEKYQLLTHAPNLKLAVVPGGVDVDYYRQPRREVIQPSIVFTGYYADEPNEDAVLWFLRRVWPAVLAAHPDAVFYVVGPGATTEMRHEASLHKGVEITGRVDDIRTWLGKAQVYICPVRMGSGMRTKILEAMSFGVPIVSTSLGIEGIPAQTGENCFIADRSDIMARHVNLLLGDRPLRNKLAGQAQYMVERKFAWPIVIDRLEQALESVTEYSLVR